jgi:acyl-CoA synthetase (NDP forming)
MDNILKQAMSTGKSALTQEQSKLILDKYHIPTVHEVVADDVHGAIKAAEQIGFPVVLKGMGSSFLHKTEQDMVFLNLMNSKAVGNAADSIVRRAGDKLDGFLVQPQINGRREFVAGLFRDKQFGPLVMFGLGGIFAEAISDVVFRLAPLTHADAADMLDQIKSKALLGKFRGEEKVNRDQLIQTLINLSHIGEQCPNIEEIDINPLIATRSGDIFAVDVLILEREEANKPQFPQPVDPKSVGYLFHPRAIAFVGASAQAGKWGNTLVANVISGEYKGDIYLVNPKRDSIMGRNVYKSIADIPGHVDLAVVTIPSKLVIGLIDELAQKKIPNMLLISSGFGETGEKGKQLEKELVKAAKQAGILIIGPNTMGVCNPHINLYCTGTVVHPVPGSTTMIAQSGNMGTQLLCFAENQNIGIRAFCGSGNEAMVAIEDYMEGLETDKLTKIIMLYIESVKNGPRFFEIACRIGKKKPIVLLKGGQSRVGNRAALSHTGAIASDSKVFDAACAQAGIVKVEHSMELLDLSAAFSSLPLPHGNRVGIMTLGGGWGVVTADLCSSQGLEVPQLTDEIIQRIDKILPAYWSRANPVDIVGENDISIPLIIMEELLKWDGCDGVINLGILGRKFFAARMADAILKADPDFSMDTIEYIKTGMSQFEDRYVQHITNLMEKYQKPVVGVSLLKHKTSQTVYSAADGGSFKGVFYETPERAVNAFAKMYQYHRFLQRY